MHISYVSFMDKIIMVFLLLLPTAFPEGSHSLWVFATLISGGRTPFPVYSYTVMLDDVRVLYYNGETDTFFGRGNTTNEDSVFDPDKLTSISDYIQLMGAIAEYLYKPEGTYTIQRMVMCELNNDEPGHMFVRDALQNSTLDELHWYNGTLKFTSEVITFISQASTAKIFQDFYYPLCIKSLKGYLEKRGNQVNRRVQPTVRFFQKPGGSPMSCLATGFYPRHINLTLLRDGQPVPEDDVMTGDLLPNDDGTYQMRKILNISAEEQGEKHKYTCSAAHLSLDNKLDVDLEFDYRAILKLVIILVPTILALVLIFAIIAGVISWKRRHTDPIFIQRRPSRASQEPMNNTTPV